MKKKLLIIIAFCVIVWLASVFVNKWLFITLTIIGILAIVGLVSFLIANKLIKKTNWWNNQYLATEQFVSNVGYRDNLIRNYDIVNLGSNPAHFAFFYEGVKGMSWATGSQGQDMDYEILKYYHSYLKEGATVIIPIMPFSAISTYLKTRPDYWGISYYSKFAKILDYSQSTKLPDGRKLIRYLSYPLLYNVRAFKYLLKDVTLDTRYQISEQPMMSMMLEQDATQWIVSWLKEFNLKSLYEIKDDRWEKYYNESIEIYKNIVDFCLERGLNPVFVCVPMTKYLSDLFPEEFYDYMIKDFVKKANVHAALFLDYTNDIRFMDENLYFNSFFLNIKGRKAFTRQVLKDLHIL